MLRWFQSGIQSSNTSLADTSNQASKSSTALVSRIPKNLGVGQVFPTSETPDIGTSALEDVALHPLQMILDMLDGKSISNLSQTNYRLFKICRKEQIKRAQSLANEACELIARALYKYGDEDKLNQLLKTPFIYLESDRHDTERPYR